MWLICDYTIALFLPICYQMVIEYTSVSFFSAVSRVYKMNMSDAGRVFFS